MIIVDKAPSGNLDSARLEIYENDGSRTTEKSLKYLTQIVIGAIALREISTRDAQNIPFDLSVAGMSDEVSLIGDARSSFLKIADDDHVRPAIYQRQMDVVKNAAEGRLTVDQVRDEFNIVEDDFTWVNTEGVMCHNAGGELIPNVYGGDDDPIDYVAAFVGEESPEFNFIFSEVGNVDAFQHVYNTESSKGELVSDLDHMQFVRKDASGNYVPFATFLSWRHPVRKTDDIAS